MDNDPTRCTVLGRPVTHPQVLAVVRKLVEDQDRIPIGVFRLSIVIREDGAVDVEFGGRLDRSRPEYG